MNKITYLLVLLALIFAGCSGNNSTSPDSDNTSSAQLSSDVTVSSVVQSSSSGITVIPEMSSPVTSSSSTIGSSGGISSSSTTVAVSPISFYKIGGLAKKLNSIDEMTSSSYDIDLDTIAMTSGFQFLLKNNGTSAIKGLKFTSSLPYFKITPDTMVTLSAPNMNSGMEQLIKVTVEHGTNASGMGFADVLTGNQYAMITISGTNDDGDFSVSYNMHVYAKRMILYIDRLDTMSQWTGTDLIYKYMTASDFVDVPQDWNPPKFVYVGSNTHDCYINYGEVMTTINGPMNLQLDSTINHEFLSDREVLGDDGVYDNAEFYTEINLLYIKERSLYTQLTSGTIDPDMNCMTLVINKTNNTEFIIK